MYCENCGVKIGEDDNFCPKCGFRQKKSPLPTEIADIEDKSTDIENKSTDIENKSTDIENKSTDIEDKSQKSNFPTTTIILIISITLLIIIGLYLLTPETRSVPYQESYEEPIYRTEYYEEPVYRTEIHTYSCGFLNLKTCSDQKQVFDHNEQKSRQVFNHNEIRYRTKYKDVTKRRYEWLIGTNN